MSLADENQIIFSTVQLICILSMLQGN